MSATGAGRHEQDRRIHHFVDRFADAWNHQDVKRLGSMFSEGAVFASPSGHAVSRAEIEALLRRERKEFFNGRALTVSIRSISLRSPDRVTVEADYMLDGYTAMGVGSAAPGSMTLTLREESDRWSIEKAVMQR